MSPRPPEAPASVRVPPAAFASGLRLATHAVVVVAGAVLLWTALAAHPVGDYHAESDFYGGYAAGARLIEHGALDPARYPVVGPLYECALALFGFIGLDLFLIARLLSVAAACAALALFAALVRHGVATRAGPKNWPPGAGPEALAQFGALAGFWFALLLAVNPVFMRYGYSATNDMLALALMASALRLLVGSSGRGLLGAGALAALAALTRYSAAVLLPAGALALALWPPAGLARRSAIARFAGGFALIALPWTLYSLAHGHVPGEPLIRYFSFYANPDANRSVQDLSPAAPDSLKSYRSLGGMLRRDPAGLVFATLRNIPEHLMLEARTLLGWPAAALAIAGAAIALISRTSLGLAPLWLIGLFQFLALLPVFHSERYALPLAPIWLSFAALALIWPVARPRAQLARWLAALAGAAALALTLRTSIADQREAYRLLPTETLEAGAALRQAAGPASRVIARKGQVGYYANVPVMPFPRFARLPELGQYARSAGADFLYFSWYEAQLRPEFAWLLDTTAAAPGLGIVHVTREKPSVLYRIGADFGREPAWLADPWLRRLHEARALVGVVPESTAAPYRITLAIEALDRGAPGVALGEVDQALLFRPREPLAWQARGLALIRLARHAEAVAAFERSLVLEPNDSETRALLGVARDSLRARGPRSE